MPTGLGPMPTGLDPMPTGLGPMPTGLGPMPTGLGPMKRVQCARTKLHYLGPYGERTIIAPIIAFIF